jgi:hypothetical protein
MNQRPTPETDGIEFHAMAGMMPPYNTVPADFARRLERERDEAREHLRHLHATIGPRMSADEPTADERAALFDAWKAAGDYLSSLAPPFTAEEERERSKMRAGVI